MDPILHLIQMSFKFHPVFQIVPSIYRTTHDNFQQTFWNTVDKCDRMVLMIEYSWCNFIILIVFELLTVQQLALIILQANTSSNKSSGGCSYQSSSQSLLKFQRMAISFDYVLRPNKKYILSGYHKTLTTMLVLPVVLWLRAVAGPAPDELKVYPRLDQQCYMK